MRMNTGSGDVKSMREFQRTGILSLDDELDDLEKEYGCKLEDLNEPDIEEIVFRIRGEYPMSAEYDPAFIAIFYKVDPDWRYNIW